MLRIAFGGFFHESNAFNPIITGSDDFIIFREEEIFPNRDSFLLAKGVIEFFSTKQEIELIPLVFAKAVPNGEVNQALYVGLRTEFLQILRSHPAPDAIILTMHGSIRVKNLGSMETDLLHEIRLLLPDTPIFCGLDMHATLTPAMLHATTAMTGFKTAPHIDVRETGAKIASIAFEALSQHVQPAMHAVRIPWLIAGEKSETGSEPMLTLIQALHHAENDPDVMAASFFMGYPWADTPDNGVTTLVVTRNLPEKAKIIAENLAAQFRAHRHDFHFSAPAFPPDEALTLALLDTCKPVFISDSGDNPTAGSTGDNTTLLALLTTKFRDQLGSKRILIAGIYDPEASALCLSHHRQTITLSVGGVFDTHYCRPVTLTGIPTAMVEDYGLFHSQLICLETDAFDLILTSKHIGFTDTSMFRALHLDYMAYDIIIVKLGYLTEDFQPIAAKSYMALTPGCTDEQLHHFPFTHPFDLI